MNNDLISKQAVIKAVDKHTFDTDKGLCLDDDITCILEEIPSTMNDLISRQDAINALSDGALVNYQAAGHNNGLVKAIDVIKGLPSAQSGRYKWNPIKDGLPDEEGVYFVTDDAGGMATVYLDVFSHYEDGSPYWLYSQNVTAWMHTPEPYTERC